jgi:hypothetical protein
MSRIVNFEASGRPLGWEPVILAFAYAARRLPSFISHEPPTQPFTRANPRLIFEARQRMTAKHIRTVGVILLLAGCVAAPTIYFTTPPDESPGILGIDIRTNRDRNQLERMGGKTYVLFKDFDEWFASLWHGRRLAGTVGVLCASGFLISRGLARVHEDHLRDVAARSRAS